MAGLAGSQDLSARRAGHFRSAPGRWDIDSENTPLVPEPGNVNIFAQKTGVWAAPRGIEGDFWADVELGQRDFTEINERMIVPFKLKQPAGVAVDRSVSPGRMYVWDSGNNRILGVDLAACYNGQRPCSAALVLGQPSLTDHGACNLDSSFATYPLRAAGFREYFVRCTRIYPYRFGR